MCLWFSSLSYGVEIRHKPSLPVYCIHKSSGLSRFLAHCGIDGPQGPCKLFMRLGFNDSEVFVDSIQDEDGPKATDCVWQNSLQYIEFLWHVLLCIKALGLCINGLYGTGLNTLGCGFKYSIQLMYFIK